MLDPQHLVELAQTLVHAHKAGAPRQANLRRAVSTAYYGMFHALCGAVADMFVPANAPDTRALFYRALDHGSLKKRCEDLGKSPLQRKQGQFFKMAAFCQDLRDFANDFVVLQEVRHLSDYDPDYKLTKAQAQQYVEDAKDAIVKLGAANDAEKSKFLAYMLFNIRS